MATNCDRREPAIVVNTVQLIGNQLAQFSEAANNGRPDDVETIGDIRLFGEHGDESCWL